MDNTPPYIAGYRARIINRIIDWVKSERISGVVGGTLKQTNAGKTLIIGSGSQYQPAGKFFDIDKISGTTVHFKNCFFQWGRELKTAGSLTFTATAGEYIIYAMLSDSLTCKITNDANDNNDEQLFPMALYSVKVAVNAGNASMEIVCDLRGSQVVIMS